jgi:hypothetical protein
MEADSEFPREYGSIIWSIGVLLGVPEYDWSTTSSIGVSLGVLEYRLEYRSIIKSTGIGHLINGSLLKIFQNILLKH